MDKYEFNIKVEQMKKLVSRKDYETAAKIADTIDWRRVRSANLLTTVASIYEEIKEYQEAIDVLLIAFERAPGGKFLLYQLTVLALKNKNISEAEAYYNEFCDIAGEDSRKNLLKYLIMKEKGASIDQLIVLLESYVKEELDEKWLYELAEMYHQAGLNEQCVQLCDKIILMFGIGTYVEKALELKQEYEPLNQYQQDLLENKEKYEEKLREVEREFGSTPSVKETVPEQESNRAIDEEVNEILSQGEELHEPEPIAEPEEMPQELVEEPIQEFQDYPMDEPEEDYFQEEEYPENQIQPEYVAEPEEHLDDYDSEDEEFQNEIYQEPEPQQDLETEDTNTETVRQVQEMQQIKAVTPMAAEALKRNLKDDPSYLEHQQKKYDHTLIESEETEIGIKFAIQTLKRIHKKNEIKRPVIKITGERINKKGFTQSKHQLAGKDLIIEQAGDMTINSLTDLKNWMLDVDIDSTVIMVDNPRQVYRLMEDYSVMKYLFLHQDVTIESLFEEKPKEHLGVFIKEEAKIPVKAKEEMDWQEFEEYACKYANEIDCFIPEKSLPALQERIELMESDGIPLTKENAEELIEAAADKAEKPSIGRAITGVFAPKYNKDGLLVLREQHFLD